mmetsp:Transcript_5551/g.8486  ORF Transcript_5551/g.8486 Transcript_5551/m.8486 type:complete len:132 (-) Transcript_5551:276-671(-)
MSFYSMKDPGPWTVEESELTSEHLSLIGFAARLGTSIANDSHLVEDSEVRKEAELLMSLLSSTPTTKSLFCDEKDLKSGEDAPMKSPPRASSYRKKTFSFCKNLRVGVTSWARLLQISSLFRRKTRTSSLE